jgi:PAS domain S-box-containing protein
MRYVEYSARFVADYGLPADQDLRGRSHYDLFPALPPHWPEIHRRVLQGEELSADEEPMTRAGGGTEWVRWSMKPWYADDGTVGGALLFSEIVTAAVLARRAIETQARRLSLAHDAAGLGSWELDLTTQVPTEWSARARELIGVSPEEVPSLERLTERVHPDDRQPMQSALARAQEPGFQGHYHVEFRVVLPGGETRWLDDCGQIEYDDHHRPYRAVGVVRDVSEAKRHEQSQRLLINELNHRVKNTLATVQALAMQSLRDSSGGDGVGAFIGRLKALATGHDVLAQEHWEGAPLQDVVARAIAPNGARIVAHGPHVWLPPRQALAVTLALHELSTNAVKYGALSESAGNVDVGWNATTAGFRLRWQERGGPPVTAPARRGFGTKLLERALAVDIDGQVQIEFNPAGVRCTIDARTPKNVAPTIAEA